MAILVTEMNALAIWIRHHLIAIRATIYLMCSAFLLVGMSAILQSSGRLPPFVFMVACGVGMYVPYVAFHTTLFERLVAASRHPGNLVFLMYVADALGYLGYSTVLVFRTTYASRFEVLPLFLATLMIVAFVSVLALLLASHYFRRVLIHPVPVSSQPAAPNLTATNERQIGDRN